MSLTKAEIAKMLLEGKVLTFPCGCIADMRSTRDGPRMNYSPCPAHIGLAAEAAQLEAA